MSPPLLSRRKMLARALAAGGGLAVGPWSGALRALQLSGGGRFAEARAGLCMNTIVEVVAVGESPGRLPGACEAALAACRSVEAEMNFFDPASELSRLNQSAGRGWTEVSPELFAVLSAARSVFEKSLGAFDPTVGASVELFRQARRQGRWPEEGAAEKAAQTIGMGQVDLRDGRRVRLLRPGVRLDLSGIAKGFATGQAAAAMEAAGARAGVVNAGGDLYAFGTDRWNPPPAALADPFAPEAVRHRLFLLEEALATSGDAEQGVWLEGRPCSHLIDPATGAPLLSAAASASVRAESAALADAWASALFVRPELAGRAPVENLLVLSPMAEKASAGFFSRPPGPG